MVSTLLLTAVSSWVRHIPSLGLNFLISQTRRWLLENFKKSFITTKEILWLQFGYSSLREKRIFLAKRKVSDTVSKLSILEGMVRRAVTSTTPVYAQHNAHSWYRQCSGGCPGPSHSITPREGPEGPILLLFSGGTVPLLDSPNRQAPWKNWQRSPGPPCLAGTFYPTPGGCCHMLRAPTLKPRTPGFESQHCDPGKAS